MPGFNRTIAIFKRNNTAETKKGKKIDQISLSHERLTA